MLKSKQLLGGLLIVGVSIALIQCKKKTETPTNNNGTDGTGATTLYTYTKDIAPIMTSNCGCHVTGGKSPNLTTYANLKSVGTNLVKVLSPGGKMTKPEYKYNVDNSNKIINWVQGGSPE